MRGNRERRKERKRRKKQEEKEKQHGSISFIFPGHCTNHHGNVDRQMHRQKYASTRRKNSSRV
jgi:hypothetical protein